ncbi:unnamed protein product [Ixodes persulcatus]
MLCRFTPFAGPAWIALYSLDPRQRQSVTNDATNDTNKRPVWRSPPSHLADVTQNTGTRELVS